MTNAIVAYNPSNRTISSIQYMVSTTGDSLFQSTIASTDSPDYTSDKAEALAQCLKLVGKKADGVTDLASEVVVS